MIFILFIFLVLVSLGFTPIPVARAQQEWNLIRGDTPEHLSTTPDAQCSPRTGAALWYQPNDGIYMFGGNEDATPLSDLWKYELDTRRWLWQPDPPTTVDPVSFPAYWQGGWLYGGKSPLHGPSDKMWQYNFQIRKWKQLISTSGANPGPRYGSAFWKDTNTDTLYLYGGNGGKADLWAYKTQWTNITYAGDAPGPRIHATAVMAHDEMTVYLFGGTADDEHDDMPIGRMRELDLTTMVWSITKIDNHVGPTAMTQHLMWMSPTQTSIYLFGDSTMWEYKRDQQTWMQHKGNRKISFRGSSICSDDDSGNVFVFGGEGRNHLWMYGRSGNGGNHLSHASAADAATAREAATVGAVTSSILVFFLFISLLYLCVKKYKKSNFATIQTYIATPRQQDSDSTLEL